MFSVSVPLSRTPSDRHFLRTRPLTRNNASFHWYKLTVGKEYTRESCPPRSTHTHLLVVHVANLVCLVHHVLHCKLYIVCVCVCRRRPSLCWSSTTLSAIQCQPVARLDRFLRNCHDNFHLVRCSVTSRRAGAGTTRRKYIHCFIAIIVVHRRHRL